MKKYVLMLVALTFGFVLSYGQNEKPLKGPKAKNAKPWMAKKQKNEVAIAANYQRVTGPVAKNAKPWQSNKARSGSTALAVSAPSRLTGPAAKNAKPWNRIRPDTALVGKPQKKLKNESDEVKKKRKP